MEGDKGAGEERIDSKLSDLIGDISIDRDPSIHDKITKVVENIKKAVDDYGIFGCLFKKGEYNRLISSKIEVNLDQLTDEEIQDVKKSLGDSSDKSLSSLMLKIPECTISVNPKDRLAMLFYNNYVKINNIDRIDKIAPMLIDTVVELLKLSTIVFTDRIEVACKLQEELVKTKGITDEKDE